MVASAPPIERRASRVPRVRARRRPRGPQRTVRHRVPAGRGRPLRPEWPSWRVLDTARLARRVLSRDECTGLPAEHAGPPLPLDDHARSPCAVRRPRDRRRPARPDRAGRHRGRADARGADDLLLAGARSAAAQAPSRRGPPPRARRLPVRGRRRAACSTSASRSTCAARVRQLLHRQRDPHAGWPRWSAWPEHVTPRAVPDHPRGGGPRAAADRAAQAALQPALPVSRDASVWVKLTVEAFPRLSMVREAPRRRGDLSRAVLLPSGRRAGHRSGTRGVPRAPVHAAAQPSPADPCVHARRDGPVRSAVRGRRVGRGLRRARRRGAARDVGGPRAPGQPASRRASRPWRRPTATRTLPRIAIGCASFLRTAARMQRLEGLGRCAELVAARPRPDGAWEIVLVRRGRLAGTSVVPVGVDPKPWVQALVDTDEVVPAGPGSRCRRPPPRRSSACCAGSTLPTSGWCARR